MLHEGEQRKPLAKEFLYIFFDFETRQDENMNEETDSQGKSICFSTILFQVYHPLNKRTTEWLFIPYTSVQKWLYKNFMTYVMEVRKCFKKVRVIAHNG